MAHYKNVVRDRSDFDLEIKGRKIYVLDEWEKLDKFPSAASPQTIQGPRIVIIDTENVITDCKIRDKDFWAMISSEMASKKSCSKKPCSEKPAKKAKLKFDAGRKFRQPK
tara:strand:- start:759 stop:1088 length:330 start_codon:yes stop_codon:yes gene_type:complete